jgi:hypothetical protein
MQRITAAMTAAALVAAIGSALWQAHASGDLVKFPETYASGVNYGGVDRVDIKERREFYTSQAAIDAVRSGQPIPSGTVVTMVHYKAKQDDQGNLLKGPDGHLMKGEITQFGVMEKRTGWGAEYPPELRNGEWEYQTFKADRSVNDKANLRRCFECHKPNAQQDFLFSFAQMKGAK